MNMIYGTSGRNLAEHLTNQFRPEFVKTYKVPLSADACSGFGRIDKSVNDAEIRAATEHLLSTTIPAFAE